MPVILNDEFGYWSNADLLVNRNWVDLAKETPYYSLGYSLVLVPVLFFCKSYKIAYHTALVLNSVFIVVEYFCAYYILSIKNPKSENYIVTSVESIAVVLLASSIFYSHIAWCEIFITMIIWIIAALFVSCEHKFKTYKIVLMCLLSGYSYIIHQRAIGVLIVFALSLLWLLLAKKKYFHIISIVVTVGLAIFLQSIIRDFQDNLIDNMRSNILNYYAINSSLVGDKLGKVMAEFVNFLVSFAGKIYILFVCSLGVYAIGLKEYILRLIKTARRQKAELIISETFFALLIVIMVGLNTIQTINSAQRKDVIVYTRYMEFVFGPFMLFSLDYLVKNIKKNYKMLMVTVAGLIPLTFIVLKQFLYAADSFNDPCSPFMAGFVELFTDDYKTVISCVVIVLIVFLLLCSLLGTMKNKQLSAILICVAFIAINVYVVSFADKWLSNVQEKFYLRVEPVAEIINKDKEDKPIYFIVDNEKFVYSINIKYLQFVLYDRPINVVHSYGQINYEGEYFLLTNSRVYPVLNDAGLEYEVTTPFTNLYIVEGHARGEKK
ncbi:MAG: hypothetical protein MJ172_07745 [Clostridia bacterium]|nr:hypothetical protein [Clostridia bacterium]